MREAKGVRGEGQRKEASDLQPQREELERLEEKSESEERSARVVEAMDRRWGVAGVDGAGP